MNSPAIDDVVEDVKAALMDRGKKYTEEARKLIDLRVLAAKVKAGIATNPRFFVPTLDVFTDGDAVVLRGSLIRRRSLSRSRKRPERWPRACRCGASCITGNNVTSTTGVSSGQKCCFLIGRDGNHLRP